MKKSQPYSPEILFEQCRQRVFRNEQLRQIAFPIGGIGAGTVCLNGIGGLQDFSIRHHPVTTAVPDGQIPGDAAFAVIHLKSDGVTRLVEGPYPKEWIYNQGLKTQGLRIGGHEGFPRFRDCEFAGEFPFGTLQLSDPNLPLRATITGFNPFIPGDVKNSAIPCAVMEYTFENTGATNCEFEFSYHLSHLAPGADVNNMPLSVNTIMPGRGVFFSNQEEPDSPHFGSASISVIGHAPVVKGRWFRGGWFDSLSVLWRELENGTFSANDGSTNGINRGRNGGSILLMINLAPQERITIPILITWYFPNVDYSYGLCEDNINDCSACNCSGTQAVWQPYYAGQWQDARDVAAYVHEHYASLKQRTQAFHDALFGSSLPWYVLDAVSANLGIIKSPTVLLQKNGNMWAWEGCFCDRGCCAGSCTHVWNYAQAIPHLFPRLERTLREQELERSMNEEGHITFRSALPDGKTEHLFHAASDGQLGGIMKVYREWQISGDDAWLHKMLPLAKRSLDFCIRTWDPDHQGVLMEPHHNTYDIEFWGPDGMCSSFYIGALCAMSQMMKVVGQQDDSDFYQSLAEKGAGYLDQHLFNGEYYEQKVMTEGLQAFADYQQQVKPFAGMAESSLPEEIALLLKEGPKYQYGKGCISDGVMGSWLAEMCSLQSCQTADHVKQHLDSIFAYNFRHSLWEHANPQRPGYALGEEPGLLLCTWPHGEKPSLPFVYSDEVWTGIEYQVASHLILNGEVEKGLSIVHATRSRYDGLTRNPWNEYECGSYYARAMASYSLLFALSGVRYSAVSGVLSIAPRIHQDDLRVFFAAESGWGTVELHGKQLTIDLCEGSLDITQAECRLDGFLFTKEINTVVHAGKPMTIVLD